jgi:hypothetical protein
METEEKKWTDERFDNRCHGHAAALYQPPGKKERP